MKTDENLYKDRLMGHGQNTRCVPRQTMNLTLDLANIKRQTFKWATQCLIRVEPLQLRSHSNTRARKKSTPVIIYKSWRGGPEAPTLTGGLGADRRRARARARARAR